MRHSENTAKPIISTIVRCEPLDDIQKHELKDGYILYVSLLRK